MNIIEKNEDLAGTWRRYVNQILDDEYQLLFARLDQLIMIETPSMKSVFQWRRQQEQQLRIQCGTDAKDSQIMNDQQLQRFIMHYERLTQWMLDEMPARANAVLALNAQHQIANMCFNVFE